MTEEAVCFGEAGRLIGVVTQPLRADEPRTGPAVVLCGAGIIHHVGPHRLYVKLARRLAALGFVVLRFDFSSIGDSQPRCDGVPLALSAVGETQQAMDWLHDAHGIDRFVLMGLCSGAGFSFRTACADRRVVAVTLINPAAHRWGTPRELHRTMLRHYWRMASSPSFRAKNLRKVLTLNVDGEGIVKTLAGRLRAAASSDDEPIAASTVAASFEGLLARGVRVQMVYSEADEGLDYFDLFLRRRLERMQAGASLRFETIRGANHTFTLLAHQRDLIDAVCRWAEPLQC